MKKLIAAFALFACSNLSFADDRGLFDFDPASDWTYTVGYNIFTTHTSSDGFNDSKTDERRDWNEANEFIMLRVNVSDNVGFGVGNGINSYYEESYWLGMELSSSDNNNGNLDFGIDLGISTGYDELIGATDGILPFLNPFIRYNEQLLSNLTVSGKVGTVNFMAFNAFVELTFSF